MKSQIQHLNNAKNANLNSKSLFNFSSRLDFSVIVNTQFSKIEKGLLITRDGNYAYASTIPYYGDSNIMKYKTRFYNNGRSLVLFHTSEYNSTRIEIDGKTQFLSRGGFDTLMNFIFNMENIKKDSESNYKLQKNIKYLKTMVAYYLPKNLQIKSIEWVKKELETK